MLDKDKLQRILTRRKTPTSCIDLVMEQLSNSEYSLVLRNLALNFDPGAPQKNWDFRCGSIMLSCTTSAVAASRKEGAVLCC